MSQQMYDIQIIMFYLPTFQNIAKHKCLKELQCLKVHHPLTIRCVQHRDPCRESKVCGCYSVHFSCSPLLPIRSTQRNSSCISKSMMKHQQKLDCKLFLP